MSEKQDKPKEQKEIFQIKNAADLQRIKLERLMKNPAKPVVIPERPKSSNKLFEAPDFVRNVMGSSAGAGSGEFHVYRHIRRREYARQKVMQIMSEKEEKDEAFHRKLEENQRLADERTAKKRAKRLKRKQKQKQGGKKSKSAKTESDSSESEESEPETAPQDGESQTTGKDEKPSRDETQPSRDVGPPAVDVTSKDESVRNTD